MAEQLGQQALLEAPPTRRVQVPVGARSRWGVDPSSKLVCVGRVAGSGERDVRTAHFPTRAGAARLHDIYAHTMALARELALEEAPGIIVVEQPSGKQVNNPLVEAVGVITCAIFRGVLSATGREPRMETVVSGTWKRDACGRGDLYKPKPAQLRAGAKYGVLSWANLNGYAGASWDEADAWGIAEHARLTYGLVER